MLGASGFRAPGLGDYEGLGLELFGGSSLKGVGVLLAGCSVFGLI